MMPNLPLGCDAMRCDALRCVALRCVALRCWILFPAARLHILITCTSANIGLLYLRVNAAVRGVSHTAFRQRMPCLTSLASGPINSGGV
jgi:hypothetical protein